MILASDAYRDGFRVEIYHEDAHWAEVSYDTAKEVFVVLFGPPLRRTRFYELPLESYELPLDEVQEALEKAKQRLIAEGYGPSAVGKEKS